MPAAPVPPPSPRFFLGKVPFEKHNWPVRTLAGDGEVGFRDELAAGWSATTFWRLCTSAFDLHF